MPHGFEGYLRAHLGVTDNYVENSKAKHVANLEWNPEELPELMDDCHMTFVNQ